MVEPKAILDWRTRQLRNRTITKVLIQWHELAPEDATWETLHQLQQQFPNFHLYKYQINAKIKFLNIYNYNTFTCA